MKAREDLIQTLKEEANDNLSVIIKNPDQYVALLTNLVAQTFFSLVEKDVFIKCREADVQLVEQALEGAKAIYRRDLKREVNCTIMKTYLPADM